MNTNKKTIKLTENSLKILIEKTIRNILNEGFVDNVKTGIKTGKEAFNYGRARDNDAQRSKNRYGFSSAYGDITDELNTSVKYVTNTILKMNIPITKEFIQKLSLELQNHINNERQEKYDGTANAYKLIDKNFEW